MHRIELKINDKVYERFLWLLSKFNKEEVEIISDSQDFHSIQEHLQKELDDIQGGNAKFISQSDLEKRLDQII